MYKRKLEQKIKDNLFKKKVIILYGPRQVGKTTLVKKIYDQYEGKKLYMQCDIPSNADHISKPEPSLMKKFFGDAKLVIIDEAQMVENIGVSLKVFFDTYPEVQIIATGSSSFDLANKVREPLTGRALEYMMYPLSADEIIETENRAHYISNQPNYLKFGLYPGIINLGHDSAISALGVLENNTFYKDILTLDNIRKPKVLQDLLKYMALSLGSVLTSNNLANELKTTSKTIERYIDILEKMFIIKRLYGYSNNKINEIKKGYKIYFTDIGLRNSLINNFNDINIREDVGGLFENYFIIERLKKTDYDSIFVNSYFWQGERGLEVDYLEERDGKLTAFECKVKNRKSKGVNTFKDLYPKAEVNIVSLDNYLDFVV